MNYDCFEVRTGKNGKNYWVAAKKIIPPIAVDGANYEVKYRKAKPGENGHDLLWEDSTWVLDEYYTEDDPCDAVRKCIDKLRQQGIII